MDFVTVLCWVGAFFGLLFIVGVIAIAMFSGALERIEELERAELKDNWFWSGEDDEKA